MLASDKTLLAELANEVGRLSRYGGAPRLTSGSSRESVIAWLQWNDPNGIHTDELAEAEGADPYTTDGAWDALTEMLAD